MQRSAEKLKNFSLKSRVWNLSDQLSRENLEASSGDSVCSPDEKKQKESSGDIILEAFNMAEGMAEGLAEKVDLILSKLSKLDKLDQIELRLNNLTTSVSSIEMSVSIDLKKKSQLSILKPRPSISRSTS